MTMRLYRGGIVGWVATAMVGVACGGTGQTDPYGAAQQGGSPSDGGAPIIGSSPNGGGSGAPNGAAGATGHGGSVIVGGRSTAGGTGGATTGGAATGGRATGGLAIGGSGPLCPMETFVSPIGTVGSATGCTYPVPRPTVDRPVDFEGGTVVAYYPGGSDPADSSAGVQLVQRAWGDADPACPSPANPALAGIGWYYSRMDDLKTPIEFTLCPSTCALVSSDAEAQIRVSYLCWNGD